MKVIWNIFLLILKALNAWLFMIPSRFSVLALGGNFLIIQWFQNGKPLYLLERELRNMGGFVHFAFWIGFGLPMFLAFFYSWSDAKMTSSKFRKNNTDAIDRVIEYRNGQIGVQTAQKAFETFKNTTSLDMMKANSNSPIFEKSIQGFNVEFANKPAQEVYKGLTKKDD